MKKLAVILLSVMIATTFLTSCGKDKAKDVKDEVKKEIKYDFTDKSKTMSLNLENGFKKDQARAREDGTEIRLSKKSDGGPGWMCVKVNIQYDKMYDRSLDVLGHTLTTYIYAEDLKQEKIKKYGQDTIQTEFVDGYDKDGKKVKVYSFIKKDKKHKGYGFKVNVREEFYDGDEKYVEKQADKIKFDFKKSKLKMEAEDKDDK